TLARRFRKKALERHGYKKGAVKKALEEAMTRYVSTGEVDWGPLKGSLRSKLGSVELQHSAWGRTD
ncbi:MAG TPA: hypothetical protein VJR06_05905, partial [Nitrososphaerales archaeon]|nr:hypothetical protein [Nitrososphaerales archaeon]